MRAGEQRAHLGAPEAKTARGTAIGMSLIIRAAGWKGPLGDLSSVRHPEEERLA